MENYSYPSYPDSSESSPRSREIDFENPPPWDDQQPPPNYKAKFMCTYGGKIQPRSHDNQLSCVGGETKILSVDRNIKFQAMLSKLSALCDGASEVTFKYQLPGEDLDALISVTNDDDLEHMMHEYDRLYRASAKPARMRLFLFPLNNSPASFASDRDRFAEALNSGPVPVPPDPVRPPPAVDNNVDFLFGFDKGAVPPGQPLPPAAVKFHDPVPEPVAPPPEYLSRGAVNPGDRIVGSDPTMNQVEIQRQLHQEMQRLQIAEHDQSVYWRKSEDNFVGGYAGGDYYLQKQPEKVLSSNFPITAPYPAGYWQEKQVPGDGFSATMTTAYGGDQPVYVFPGPGTFYHAPMVRPPTAPATQGYYAVQRMPSDGYREPPYTQKASAQPVKPSTYAEGFNAVRSAGMPDNTGAAYAQMAYDSVNGRQVYYTPQGGVVHAPPYQGVAPVASADMRPPAVSLGQDVKVVNKISQGSA